jgi:hypothetical protein
MWGKATSHALFLGRIRLNCVARIDATSLMVMAIKVSAAPAATQWRVCCALLVTLFILGCGGTAASETAPTGLQVVPMVIPLVALNRPVWGATTADFNNDGYLDLFLGGHDGGNKIQPDVIYYGSTSGFEKSSFSFPHGEDRHHCAPILINDDDYKDLYCTVGAARGTTTNPNELWINLDGVHFAQYKKPFGAEEESGRGRLAVALNFDNKAGVDLLTTVWGARDDDLRNESGVFRNVGGIFQFAETSIDNRLGGRCLSIGDLNRDGYDDIAACNEKAGGYILLNTGAGNFVKNTIDPDFNLWRDVEISDVNGDAIADIVVLGYKHGKNIKSLAIWYGLGDGAFRKPPDIAVSCDEPANPSTLDVFCSKIAVTDINADGYGDIYVVRRLGAGQESHDGDIEDVIFFGPDFKKLAAVPLAASGMGNHVIAIGSQFVRINAGERWPGQVDIIDLKPPPIR